MGSRKRPADAAALIDWLREHAEQAIGAVIAIDTLAWGGLIPSRQSGGDLPAALARLEALRDLRHRHPSLPIMAFSSIQRINRDDDDGEEPEYGRTYGRRIWRRSVLEHRQAEGALVDDEPAELARLRLEIPDAVWRDFLSIRARTRAVNFAALDLVESGAVDALVLNQDDTTTWGLNVQDRAALEADVRRRGLGGRVLVYPGADEVAQVLMARLAAQIHRKRPRFAALYATRRGPDVQTGYEDRPLGDLVAMHLRAAGAVLVPSPLQPDAWLAVNSPSKQQGQGGTSVALESDRHGVLGAAVRSAMLASEAQVRGVERSLEVFSDAIGAVLDQGGLVSLADVAHTNGADDELMRVLEAAGHLPRFVAYGGWNTAGNALGSAVALGCLAVLMGNEGAEARARALVTRYVDDWLYQARVRTRLLLQPELHAFGLGGFLSEVEQVRVEQQALEGVNEELRLRAWPFRVTRLTYPWRRVFEIDLEVQRTDAAGRWGRP